MSAWTSARKLCNAVASTATARSAGEKRSAPSASAEMSLSSRSWLLTSYVRQMCCQCSNAPSVRRRCQSRAIRRFWPSRLRGTLYVEDPCSLLILSCHRLARDPRESGCLTAAHSRSRCKAVKVIELAVVDVAVLSQVLRRPSAQARLLRSAQLAASPSHSASSFSRHPHPSWTVMLSCRCLMSWLRQLLWAPVCVKPRRGRGTHRRFVCRLLLF